MFIRTFLPHVPQPDADAIENLSKAVIVDQKRLGGGSHSTLGTITDISPVLRLLFSRVGQPHIGPAQAFSFNDPLGMCPECNGVGRKRGVDLDKALDKSKSLNEGAILLPEHKVDSWDWSLLQQSGCFDMDKKLAEYTDAEMEQLLYAKPRKLAVQFGGKNVNITFAGIIETFESKYIRKDLKTYSERTQKMVEPVMTDIRCPVCRGARLSQAALSCSINGCNIAELSAMEIGQLIHVIREIEDPVGAPMVRTLSERLQHLIDIGLEYLSLD
jgi:excinuclease UvrABC ATPase subunit